MVKKVYAVFRRSDGILKSHPKEEWRDALMYDFLYSNEVFAAMDIEHHGEPGEVYVVLPTYLKE